MNTETHTSLLEASSCWPMCHRAYFLDNDKSNDFWNTKAKSVRARVPMDFETYNVLDREAVFIEFDRTVGMLFSRDLESRANLKQLIRFFYNQSELHIKLTTKEIRDALNMKGNPLAWALGRLNALGYIQKLKQTGTRSRGYSYFLTLNENIMSTVLKMKDEDIKLKIDLLLTQDPKMHSLTTDVLTGLNKLNSGVQLISKEEITEGLGLKPNQDLEKLTKGQLKLTKGQESEFSEITEGLGLELDLSFEDQNQSEVKNNKRSTEITKGQEISTVSSVVSNFNLTEDKGTKVHQELEFNLNKTTDVVSGVNMISISELKSLLNPLYENMRSLINKVDNLQSQNEILYKELQSLKPQPLKVLSSKLLDLIKEYSIVSGVDQLSLENESKVKLNSTSEESLIKDYQEVIQELKRQASEKEIKDLMEHKLGFSVFKLRYPDLTRDSREYSEFVQGLRDMSSKKGIRATREFVTSTHTRLTMIYEDTQFSGNSLGIGLGGPESLEAPLSTRSVKEVDIFNKPKPPLTLEEVRSHQAYGGYRLSYEDEELRYILNEF